MRNHRGLLASRYGWVARADLVGDELLQYRRLDISFLRARVFWISRFSKLLQLNELRISQMI